MQLSRLRNEVSGKVYGYRKLHDYLQDKGMCTCQQSIAKWRNQRKIQIISNLHLPSQEI